MIIQIIKNALKRFRNNLSPPNIIDNSTADDNDSQNSPCNAYYIAQSKYNLRQYKLVLWDWCNTLYCNDMYINNLCILVFIKVEKSKFVFINYTFYISESSN